ncbi:MAG TPA: hypothetical protein DCS93_04865 [Microscillaceae bacterium]|nr:hypothetical protein [Microscillaceae bacterium]
MLRPSPINTSTARVALRYGIYTGVGMALYTTVLRFLWPTAPADIRYAFMLVLVFGITRGMLAFRKENKNKMNLLQGWGAGSMLSMAAGLVYGLINLLLIFLYEPATSNVRNTASLGFLIIVAWIALVGSLMALVAAFFYKKKT